MQSTRRFRRSLLPLSARAHRRPLSTPTVLPLWVVSVSVFGLLGCKDLTGSAQLPSGTQDPSYYNTPAGALGMWAVAIQDIEQELPSYIADTGLLTDELESNATGASLAVVQGTGLPAGGSLDERILPEQGYGGTGTSADGDYTFLQQYRGLASQALGALAAYDTGAVKQGDPVAMRSELFALQGYAEILLADFFCSGVPLSTLDFQKDYTYHAGSPTDSVYWDAITKLDSAYTLAKASDSAGLQDLALVLKGRAFLDLGQYDSAAVAVAVVPSGFQYQVTAIGGKEQIINNSLNNWLSEAATVSSREGENGLHYLLGGDPRTTVDTTVQSNPSGLDGPFVPLTFPVKYSVGLSVTGFFPFTVADGIEARLIQSEVALNNNPNDPTWLTILNNLRATAPVPGTTQPATAQQLPPLTDPGAALSGTAAATARVSLLFQERAYWLFLTGHRQGDLRRMIRQYGKSPNQVYPIGRYLAPGTGTYGTDVTAPIPGAEYVNPKFQGCKSRTA